MRIISGILLFSTACWLSVALGAPEKSSPQPAAAGAKPTEPAGPVFLPPVPPAGPVSPPKAAAKTPAKAQPEKPAEAVETPPMKLPPPPPVTLPPPPPAGGPAAKVPQAAAQPPAKPAGKPSVAAAGAEGPRQNLCLECHGNLDVWDQAHLKFFVTEKNLARDVHWQKGLRCVDCHGGDPTTVDSYAAAHSQDKGYRPLNTPTAVVELCGECHANIEYMRRYRPAPRVDQLREYWTSDHGIRLKQAKDTAVATCISCHDKPHGDGADTAKHGVRPVAELDSPVYPTNVAQTCAKCHSDPQRMAGRQYHGQPIGTDQYAEWRQSTHAKALLEKGDLSAATCNDCHGNHGALPPQVDSVANACGTCHGKIAGLFEKTRMKHAFEHVGLPGCATCHNNHLIRHPTVEMLGMGEGAVCKRCHAHGEHGATVAGTETARKLRADLDLLRARIELAQAAVHRAALLGMEVGGPAFDLRTASDALVTAKVEIHSFALQPEEKLLAEGTAAAAQVQAAGEAALREYQFRRVWLAASLVPILLVIVLLLLYIRTLPIPPPAAKKPAEHAPDHFGSPPLG